MIQLDLSSGFLTFIKENSANDPANLRLKWQGKDCGFDVEAAITQIECRKRCRHKLGNFLKNPYFFFPDRLSSEQATHQAVALYHSRFGIRGEKLLDMTAGLGIDDMTFAGKDLEVICCELDEDRAAALKHNSTLGDGYKIKVLNCDSVSYLSSSEEVYDIIFIDPARRGVGDRRVYNFKDCSPDITSFQETAKNKSRLLLIKASPLLDISQTLKDIADVREIHCISVNGECKEILLVVSKGVTNTEFVAVDLNNEGEELSSFKYSDTILDQIEYAQKVEPGNFLYEPNASIMKLGCWKALQEKFPELLKLSVNSHLFVSRVKVDNFPGRILRVEKIINKKDRKSLKGFPVNIVSRNYPLSTEELRKKIGAKEGDNMFLYASRLGTTPFLALCERMV